MRSREFVTELRRNPEQNSQRDRGYDSVLQALKGRDLTQVGISMTNLPKLGLNPQSRYDTPIGIYFYPADYYVEQHGRVPFQHRAPYINVFEYTGSVLNLGEYTWEDYHRDINDRLRTGYANSYLETVIDRARHTAEAEAKFKTAAGQMWYVLMKTSDWQQDTKERSAATRASVTWNQLLRHLGYTAVIDPGTGTIHEGEPTQGVILDPRAIQMITRIKNQPGAKAYDPVGQLIIEPNEYTYIQTIEKYARNTPEYLRPQPSMSPKNMAPTQSRIDRLFMRYIEIVSRDPELTTTKDIMSVAKQAPQRLHSRFSQLAQSRETAAPADNPAK